MEGLGQVDRMNIGDPRECREARRPSNVGVEGFLHIANPSWPWALTRTCPQSADERSHEELVNVERRGESNPAFVMEPQAAPRDWTASDQPGTLDLNAQVVQERTRIATNFDQQTTHASTSKAIRVRHVGRKIVNHPGHYGGAPSDRRYAEFIGSAQRDAKISEVMAVGVNR
jgi:hypothetical protein